MKNVLILALASLLAFLGSCGGGADVAGSYQLDTSPIEAEMKKELEAMPAEQKPMMEEMLPKLMEEFGGWELNMKADNTWEMKMSIMGQADSKTGTWALEGEKLSLTAEGEDEVQEANYKGGVITMEFDDGPGGKPMKLIFNKK